MAKRSFYLSAGISHPQPPSGLFCLFVCKFLAFGPHPIILIVTPGPVLIPSRLKRAYEMLEIKSRWAAGKANTLPTLTTPTVSILMDKM